MRNTYKYLTIGVILFFFSCNDDEINPTNEQPVGNHQIATNNHMCIDTYTLEDMLNISSEKKITPNAVIDRYYIWPNGGVIKIKFLNGSNFLHDKVKKYANEWLEYANLKFEYVNYNENADIKINFDNSNGSWSQVGTNCKKIGQYNASMNFGWFTENTKEEEFSRVIIHEFGHALGLLHEHQSPIGDIKWNKEAVYKSLSGPPNYWNKGQIDHNIFLKYSSSNTNYSHFDIKSIMMYTLPSSFTLDGWSAPLNNTLSSTDKEFIAKIYPKNLKPSPPPLPSDSILIL